MWTNLGSWTGVTAYPDAARELARRVGSAAGLRGGDVVVDYGCGFGDSLRLWIESFGVARVLGVEPDPAVTAIVRERIASWKLGHRISVVTASAEGADAARIASGVTAIVSVDAAYHFSTRAAWLAHCAAALPHGGRLGVADLALTPRGRRDPRTRVAAGLVGVPKENLVTAAELEAQMTASGLQVTSNEGAGDAVLDGFADSARKGGSRVAVTRMLLRLVRRARLVDYRVIGAQRPGLAAITAP
jgi:MPBQ/MSBQ methyltransferase